MPSTFSRILPTFSASSRRIAGSGPKTLTSIGLIHAGQVANLVEDERHELGVEFRHLLLELVAQIVQDFFHRPPLAGWLQAHEDVAGVAFGGEETELGAGPPDVALNVGRIAGGPASTRRSTLSVWVSEVPTGML